MAAAAVQFLLDHNAIQMDNYLENTINIGNAALRCRLITQGFNGNLDMLSTRDSDYVSKVAAAIGKQGGPSAALTTIDLEETLKNFANWAKCTHLTQRALTFPTATMPNVTSVGTWMKHLPKKEEAKDPGKFTTQESSRL